MTNTNKNDFNATIGNTVLSAVLNLQFIFKPKYWLMNKRYNKKVDEIMNQLLDKYDFTKITDYTAFLGDTQIWIANAPYSCMYPYKFGYESRYRPSRLTIQKGLRKLQEIKDKKQSDFINSISV
ncbi:MAG TPA: hypothetical protein PKY29_04555 [Ferruginibacter sp.]|nr:hypothetical protein [Ferruginibacter sp.]HRQ20560.1 hypothetical protein [Ferruginibacter sp.]